MNRLYVDVDIKYLFENGKKSKITSITTKENETNGLVIFDFGYRTRTRAQRHRIEK